jgi:predicted nucleic acid-binding protein
MTGIDDALARLRASDPVREAGLSGPLAEGVADAGIRFAAIGGPLDDRWVQALRELAACIQPLVPGGDSVLSEGGVYHGAWIESTGTINAEVLDRFAPAVTRATHRLFADHARADGLIPYKVTADGPAFSQIQIVTPFARSVWRHHLATGRRDLEHLRRMQAVLAANDAWLAAHRDTRGTGAVEAFCTFDTGHDLSPRFWHVPDRCFHGDAARYDPASPVLPYVAPDLTANVVAQRLALADIAEELGDDPAPWRERAADSLAALWAQCFDEASGMFYDRDATGRLVRVDSDVLLRVLACGVGDDAFVAAALERHLMSTRRFLGHYGFTSLALDDPRFDHDASRNSWGGPSNFLSMIRAPDAFEPHGRVAELAVAEGPVLAALAVADRFPQSLDPWSGAPGFTSVYSPAILWYLDAVERAAGIRARHDGGIDFGGVTPTRLEHGAAAEATAYARTIDGVGYELAGDDERVVVLRDGAPHLEFARGWRVEADAQGAPVAIVGVAAAPVAGTFRAPDRSTLELTLAPNDRVTLATGARTSIGFVPPHT